MEVTVFLKNPPSSATEWQLSLYDWNKAQIGSRSGIPITDSAVFDVPPGTSFPLRVDMLLYHTGTIDYRMQSVGTVFPFPPEWYVEAFIPESGSYNYNVATEQFEAKEVPPPGVGLALYAGWNEVRYTGITQSVEAAFASIQAYFLTVLEWTDEGWLEPTTMVTGNDYSIKVTQDVLWTFEMPAVAPSEISITAPSSAEEGETVSVSTEVTNASTASHFYRIELFAVKDIFAVPAPEEKIGSLEVTIGAGKSQIVSGSFTMPAWDTHVLIMVYKLNSNWDYDNHASKVVSSSAVDEYKGSITEKILDYNGSDDPIPVDNVPQGERGKLHVRVQNDMATKQKLGIGWIVRDPSGNIVENYSDWEFGKTDPGKTHQFIGGRFDLNKLGNYTVVILLFMNREASVEAARYDGNLCSVVEVLGEAEFSDLTATYARV